MRVVLAILALVGASPASAAIWAFGISGHVTGTTRLTDINFGPPFEKTFSESYLYSDTIMVESFDSSTTFTEPSPLAPCGNLPDNTGRTFFRYCSYSGTLAFNGASIIGSNLTVSGSGGGCGGFCGADTNLRAPQFGVTFLYSAGGPAPVPEPATWAMMLAGFGILGASQRSRRYRCSLSRPA